MSQWQRPSGPLNVWKVVNGYEVGKDGTRKPVKFSIQEIPDAAVRKKEVIDLLINHYVQDEAICKCLKMAQDPDALDDFRTMWNYGLDQRVTVGCYQLDTNGKIGKLVGVNSLYVVTREGKSEFAKLKDTFKSKSFLLMWNLYDDLLAKPDIQKFFNFDAFIGSISLCVHPAYRGQRLGVYILETRRDIGKKYSIPVTNTLFSVPTSQLQAKRAGFEEVFSINYKDVIDDQGNPLFPNIESTCAKLMTMKLF